MAARFEGRRVFVTGASAGLGRALALAYAREGAHVILAARRVDRLADAVRDIMSHGGTAEAVPLDVTDTHAVRAACAMVRASQPIDVLVNNAGTAAFGELTTLTSAAIDDQVATNLTGTMHLTRDMLPAMPERGGAIVTIASMAALRPLAGCTAYAATKAGLRAFMDALREELRPRRVRCLTVFPGAIDTPIWDNIAGDFDREVMMEADDVARLIVDASAPNTTAVVEEMTIMPEAGVL